MSVNTKIAWCHHTFNTHWGCVKIGPECDHCYAEAWAKRTGNDVWGLGERRFFGDKHWREPLKWNAAASAAGERRRVFCASMGDVFERRRDAVGIALDDARVRLWHLITETPGLDWLLLTKRPQNVDQLVPEAWMRRGFPANVWMGTTAGTNEGWRKRVKYLMRIPAAVRFVSVEPQLEHIEPPVWDLGGSDRGKFPDWVITGGESGHHARPYHVTWAHRWIELGEQYGFAVFVKQLGARPHWFPRVLYYDVLDHRGRIENLGDDNAVLVGGLREPAGADPAEWPEELRVRQYPTPRAA